jgi:hypothetical protein
MLQILQRVDTHWNSMEAWSQNTTLTVSCRTRGCLPSMRRSTQTTCARCSLKRRPRWSSRTCTQGLTEEYLSFSIQKPSPRKNRSRLGNYPRLFYLNTSTKTFSLEVCPSYRGLLYTELARHCDGYIRAHTGKCAQPLVPRSHTFLFRTLVCPTINF